MRDASLHNLKDILIFLWKEIYKNFFSILVICFLCFLLTSLLEASFILFLGPILKILISSKVSSIRIIDFVGEKFQPYLINYQWIEIPREKALIFFPITIFAIVVLKNITSYLFQTQASKVSLYATKIYRDLLFKKLLESPFSYIASRSSAQWMSIIMNDVIYLQTRISEILTSLIKDFGSVTFSFLALFIINPKLASILLILGPIVAFGMGKIGKKIATYTQWVQKELSNLSSSILEMRQRFDSIFVAQSQELEHSFFENFNHNYFKKIQKTFAIRMAFAPLMELIGMVTFAGFLFYLSAHRQDKSFDSVQLLVFLVALGMLLRPFRNIGEQLTRYHETSGALRSSIQILIDASKNASTSRSLLENSDSSFFEKDQGFFIKHLACGHNQKVIITASNVLLPFGQCIGLRGLNGSGKSTFIKTLAGLLEPLGGEKDTDIRVLSKHSFLVSQQPFLFKDSIYENLIYGTKNNVSKEEIFKILNQLNLIKSIEELEDYLSKQLTAFQSNVSGGQIQRLMIARALIQKKPFIFLDEATSSLDRKNENDIFSTLQKFSKEMNINIVAIVHSDFKTTENHFDQIWSVKDGNLIV